MVWSDVLLLIVGAVSTFLFGEKLYTWFFLKQEKASKEADNEAKAVETLRQALDMIKTQLEQSNKDSIEKQSIIISQQKELFNEREDKARIREELAVAKCRECQVHGCSNREPQTGY